MAGGRGLTALLAIASLLLAIGTAEADAFCDRLQAVLGDVGRDFASVRGAQLAVVPDDGGGDDATRYAATLRLPGASVCGVDLERSDGDPIPAIYLCWFAPTPNDTGAVRHLDRQVTTCLGADPDTRGASGRGGVTAVDVQRKTFVLSITGGRHGPVVLAISGK